MPRPQRLTPAAVRYLRKRRAERLSGNRKGGTPDKVLCARWGMTRTALWQAAAGLTYKQVQP
jgi:hypothetical protein